MVSKREVVVAGEPIWLCGMTGEVRGEKKWSESRTQTNVAANRRTIDTTVNTRHEFWLVAKNGEERLVDFFDSSVNVREGQVITAIWGASAKTQSGPYLMLLNNNAQTSNVLLPDANALLKRMKLSNPFTLFASAGVAAFLVLWVMMSRSNGFLPGLIALIILAVIGFMKRTAKVKDVREAVSEAMKLESQTYRSLGVAAQERIAG